MKKVEKVLLKFSPRLGEYYHFHSGTLFERPAYWKIGDDWYYYRFKKFVPLDFPTLTHLKIGDKKFYLKNFEMTYDPNLKCYVIEANKDFTEAIKEFGDKIEEEEIDD